LATRAKDRSLRQLLPGVRLNVQELPKAAIYFIHREQLFAVHPYR
jgi:hypothetical protein